MVLNIFALIVILVLVAAAVAIVVKLGALPGKLAEQRKHPQRDAIRVLGWIGILTLGVGWLVAIVWAFCAPWPVRLAGSAGDGAGESEQVAELRSRIAALEERLSTGRGTGGNAS